jgi:hypothetical protein
LVYFAHTVLGFYEERDATEDKKEWDVRPEQW